MFEFFKRPLKDTLCKKIHPAVEASGPKANLEMKQEFGFIFR